MWKATVTLALLLMLTLSASYGQSLDDWPQPDPPPDVLTAPELRQILGQLHELNVARAENAALREHIERDREFDARERELANDWQKLSGERLGLANQETALHRERADFYELLYRSVTRKPGAGCKILKVVTIGLYRCV